MALTGVLLTAFGGPDSLDSVGPFMANLMGREPAPEIVERAKRKYLTIGGSSPLPAVTGEIATALEAALATAGHDVPVRVGMRYWDPYIADSIESMVAMGVTRLVHVSLSPFESAVSSGAYRAAVTAAVEAHPGLEVVEAPSFRESGGFVGELAAACSEATGEVPAGKRLIIFSAHSLPVRDIEKDPAYFDQLMATTAEVAQTAGLEPGDTDVEVFDGIVAPLAHMGEDGPEWLFSFQSKGVSPGEWLGPQIEDVVEAAVAAGYTGIAVCPVGFGTDHMETKYDLDVVVAGQCFDADIEFARAAVPNAAPAMIASLKELVEPLL
jgi:ferrochelatase